MSQLFENSAAVLWNIAACLIAMAAMVIWWDKVKWWWMNTWYKFPLIGRLNTLSRDPSGKDADGWSRAERSLCSDYMKYMQIQDEFDFNEKHEYLRLAREAGRKAMPAWLWGLTIALVFVEALGFGYALAGWAVLDASENLKQYGAIGLGFLVSTILVAMTHLAGHTLYASGKIQEARREWRETGQEFALYTENVSLFMPQKTDAGLPGYSRVLNRLGKKTASYWTPALTLLLVIVVAIGATYVRGQVLNKDLTQQTTAVSNSVNVMQDAGAGESNDPLATIVNKSESADGSQLPDADRAMNDAAAQQGRDEVLSTEKKGGWGTFIVLAVIFVALQGLGVMFGYQYGFAGEQSEQAWKRTGKGRFATYAEVRLYYEEIQHAAQSMLTSLQQRIMAARGSAAKESNKTFTDYLREHRHEQVRQQQDEREAAVARQLIHSQTFSAPPLAISEAPVAQASAAALASTDQAAVNLGQALATLSTLPDKTQKRQYLDRLTMDVRAQVIEALQRDKAEKEQQNKILDELL